MPAIPVLPSLARAVRESVSGLPRQFWWLWTSTLINRLGGFVVTFMALYLTVDRGYSASYAGLVAALYGLGGSVSAVVGGVLADRLGRRPTLLVSQLATAVCTAALGLVEQPVAIAAVACAVGVTSNASRPAVQAMMADLVAPEDRVRAFSLNYWAINVGFGVSSAAAGLIAAHGYLWLFLGDALATLLCAVVVFVKLPETRPAHPGTASAGPVPGAGLGTVLRDGRFMVVVGLSFTVALLFQQAATTLPVSMGADGLSSTDYGVVISVNGLLIVLLQIPVTRAIRDHDPTRLLVLSSLVCGLGFGLTAFAGSAALYALTVCVWTLAEIVHSPTSMGLVAELSPPHARGRYQGMYSLSWAVASFVAPLGGGLVIDHLGEGTLWGACAVLGTLAAGGYWGLMRARAGAVAADVAVVASPGLEPERAG